MCALYTQHPWSRKPSTQVLLGPSELARALGLRHPSVVTNWRARSPEFPDDRAGGSQPRFDLVEVVEWMLDHGPRSSTPHTLQPIDWWGYLCEAFVLARPTETPRHSVAALLALREVLSVRRLLGDEGADRWTALHEPAAAELHSLAKWTERELPDLRGLLSPWLTDLDDTAVAGVRDMVDVLGRLTGERGTELLAAALDAGRDQRPRHQRVTAAPVAQLMVALAGVRDGHTVLDPAAGEGEVLLAAHGVAPDAHLVGCDVDDESLALARLRTLVEGAAIQLHPAGDTFRAAWLQQLRADVVLVDPPVEGVPPIDRWLALGLEHLARDGRVVINLPLHLLVWVKSVRRKPDPRVTAMMEQLAEGGALRTIVVLHPRTRSDVTGPTALCVVQPDAEPTSDVDVVVVGDGATNADIVGLAVQLSADHDVRNIEATPSVRYRSVQRTDFLVGLERAEVMARSMSGRRAASLSVHRLARSSRSFVVAPEMSDADVVRDEQLAPPRASDDDYRELAIAAIQALMVRDVEAAREMLLKLERLDRLNE